MKALSTRSYCGCKVRTMIAALHTQALRAPASCRSNPTCRQPTVAPFRSFHAPRPQVSRQKFESAARRCSVAPQASTSTAKTIERYNHSLPDGMKIEVLKLEAQGPAPSTRPPLLFVHGSYHGAWCWAENFMPFFSAAGYDCYAISLRGQGGSERGDLKVSGTIASMAQDLASFVATLPRPPVLIGHSFGGIVLERYLLDIPKGAPSLAGVACLASVPPTGNYDIVIRVTKKSLVDAWKITWAFVGKSFARSLDECRYTFFSKDLPQEQLERYQKQLAACSPVRMLDLSALRKDVPLPPLPAALSTLPAYVGGGDTDIVVDIPAVEELANWFGVEPVVWRDVAHDCMLDTRWEQVAGSVRDWLDTKVPAVA